MGNQAFNIGIVCGKLGDVDGVSLEVDKWINVFRELGHNVYTISGAYAKELPNVPAGNQFLLEDIRFGSEKQQHYENQVFPHLQKSPPYLSRSGKMRIIDSLEQDGRHVASRIYEYIQEHDIDVLVAQNTNAMPMTLLGGMGIYKLVSSYRMAAIFHHHDFWWERSRFSNNRIETLLGKVMPPVLPGLEHVVLSTYAAHILRSIKRVHPRVIPNCEDFENPVAMDEYNADFRKELGFADSDILIVQPTRIVRRKRIEDSVQLIHRFMEKYPQFADRIQFIISLYQGDEPDHNYIGQIRSMCEEYSIPLHLISDRVGAKRGSGKDGRKIYTNRDVLANADLVTYLPVWEGFGNALLEAIAAKVPVITTTYLVYKTDIAVMRFKNIEIRDVYGPDGMLVIPERALDEMLFILTNEKRRQEIVDKNFDIGKTEFGFSRLKSCLEELLTDYGPEITASRKRVEQSKLEYSV
ncbi:MAG: glycosyltransferase family 4 protein [Spirochaetales bacterium]|nr:glycosyltransferase family 4 protein [Spirochaetales bacterium]